MRYLTRNTSADLPDTPEMYCMMILDVSVLPLPDSPLFVRHDLPRLRNSV